MLRAVLNTRPDTHCCALSAHKILRLVLLPFLLSLNAIF